MFSPEQIQEVLRKHKHWLREDDRGQQADFSGQDLSGVNLQQADLRDAILDDANLQNAILHRALLDDASLEGADLRNAILSDASLNGAMLNAASLEGAKLRGASFVGAVLRAASLKGVEFRSVDATRADFSFADMRKMLVENSELGHAKFREADLRETVAKRSIYASCSFRSAALSYSKFIGCELPNCIFWQSEVVRCEFDQSILRGSGASSSDFSSSKFLDTDLSEADFFECNFRAADFSDSNLDGANFSSAGMQKANLTNTSAIGTNFQGADLEDAILIQADLNGAVLSEANLVGAELAGANLQQAILHGTVVEELQTDVDSTSITGPKTAYGAKRKAVKGLEKIDSPIRAAAFKRAFPEAFEKIKHDIGGGTLTPQSAKRLIDSYGLVWFVTLDTYTSGMQRLSPKPNKVLQLNVDIDLLTDDAKKRETIEAIRATSVRSSHPVLTEGLFTIGWVRYSEFKKEGVLLIEEVQSDLPIVRKHINDADFERELRSRGLTKDSINSALNLLEPFAVRFYEDALSLAFDIAAELGLSVEMLTWEQKQQFGSPRSIYEKLPKAMGMKKVSEFGAPVEGSKMWVAIPNPSRTRNKSIPQRFMWRRA